MIHKQYNLCKKKHLTLREIERSTYNISIYKVAILAVFKASDLYILNLYCGYICYKTMFFVKILVFKLKQFQFFCFNSPRKWEQFVCVVCGI